MKEEMERIEAVIFLREESVRVLKKKGAFGAGGEREKISRCFERRGLLFGEINPCFKGIRDCYLERSIRVLKGFWGLLFEEINPCFKGIRGCYLEGSIRVLKGFWGLLLEEISPCFREIKGCCLGKHQSVF